MFGMGRGGKATEEARREKAERVEDEAKGCTDWEGFDLALRFRPACVFNDLRQEREEFGDFLLLSS